jgi:hypothetical protein
MDKQDKTQISFGIVVDAEEKQMVDEFKARFKLNKGAALLAAIDVFLNTAESRQEKALKKYTADRARMGGTSPRAKEKE